VPGQKSFHLIAPGYGMLLELLGEAQILISQDLQLHHFTTILGDALVQLLHFFFMDRS
jgi:hypothetical protein